MTSTRTIENPYWANKEKQHVIAEFVYSDTGKRATASIMNDGTNRDYDELMKNTEFKNILTSLIVMRSNGINSSLELKSIIENLIEGISKEMDKLN